MTENEMTTTQIFKDEHGNYMTRIWYMEKEEGRVVQKMRVEATNPSQIRIPRTPLLFTPETVVKKERHIYRQ